MSTGIDCMQAVCGTEQVSYQGQVLDLERPFKRATMHELVQEVLGQSPCLCCFPISALDQQNTRSLPVLELSASDHCRLQFFILHLSSTYGVS